MNILIFLLILGFSNSFFVRFGKRYNRLHCNNNDFDKILDEKFQSMIEEFEKKIEKHLQENIIFSPQKEEDIKDDSFESYLRDHFNDIKYTNNKIDFERFYQWRKTIGTVLTKEEILNIYNIINKNEKYCDLINFILLNKVIDENDGADF
tara:strand:- start:493 stop:942 length:450 start_codon:yes stop_codon:yes gene_type:complete